MMMRRACVLLLLVPVLLRAGHRPTATPITLTAPPVKDAPTLQVSPRVGIAPMAIVVAMRVPVPKAADRELELLVLEGEWIVRRSSREIARPHLIRIGFTPWPTPMAVGHRAAWTLTAPASYVVAGCVWPGGRCAKVDLEVR